MKKILFLHDTLGMGGAEQLRLTLLKYINTDRYQVRICCIAQKGIIGWRVQELGFPVDELNLDPNPKNILTTARVFQYLRSQADIDILHTSLFNANFHGRIAGFLCGIPKIVSEIHGQHYEFSNPRYLLHLFSEFLLARLTHAIICCSDDSREFLIGNEKMPAHKIHTITNCIDPQRYQIKEQREEVRQRLGIKDELVLITVASFWRIKGHIYLAQALSELKQSGCDFKWICIGDGALKETIRDKCKKLGLGSDLVQLGNIENVSDYLNASDIFVLPSLSEALSLAVLEAMYLGLPCVVTNVGFNRKLIINRHNGLIVEPGNAQALKEAICFYLRNKKKASEFCNINKEKIEKSFLLNDDYLKKFYQIWS